MTRKKILAQIFSDMSSSTFPIIEFFDTREKIKMSHVVVLLDLITEVVAIAVAVVKDNSRVS